MALNFRSLELNLALKMVRAFEAFSTDALLKKSNTKLKQAGVYVTVLPSPQLKAAQNWKIANNGVTLS